MIDVHCMNHSLGENVFFKPIFFNYMSFSTMLQFNIIEIPCDYK
jgi:hypothetical protein